MNNARIAEIQRERRRLKRMVERTTAGSATVGSPMMNRRERIGGIVDQMRTYSISGGTLTQTDFDFYGVAKFGTSTFGR